MGETVMDNPFYNLWRFWVELFSGLGLPWGKTTIATVVMAVMFYFVGKAFKFLTSKEN
jgi:hypothetical protein